jgi:hypothetical protein
MIDSVDYQLTLSTGERITVLELDPDRIPVLRDRGVLAAAAGVLRRCTFAPRPALEMAKAGFDRDLLPLLRGPDIGLLKSERPACRLLDECSMAVVARCTLRNIRTKKDKTPGCWEYGPEGGLTEEVRRAAMDVGTSVGHALMARHYPVLVGLTVEDLGTAPR